MATLNGERLTDTSGNVWVVKSSLVSEDGQRASFVCDREEEDHADGD